jgi:hypothetical protein
MLFSRHVPKFGGTYCLRSEGIKCIKTIYLTYFFNSYQIIFVLMSTSVLNMFLKYFRQWNKTSYSATRGLTYFRITGNICSAAVCDFMMKHEHTHKRKHLHAHTNILLRDYMLHFRRHTLHSQCRENFKSLKWIVYSFKIIRIGNRHTDGHTDDTISLNLHTKQGKQVKSKG